MDEKFDGLEIYCPHMGTLLPFSYCRQTQGRHLPCRNLINCWQKRIPVDAFLAENFIREELELAFGGLPKTRMERIFDCLEETKNQRTDDR